MHQDQTLSASVPSASVCLLLFVCPIEQSIYLCRATNTSNTVFLPSHTTSRVGLCVVCMGAEHEWSALEGAEHAQCERLPLWTLHFHITLFEEGAQAHGPRGTGPAFAEAERWLRLWRMQMYLAEGTERGTAFSLPSPGRSSAFRCHKHRGFFRPSLVLVYLDSTESSPQW